MAAYLIVEGKINHHERWEEYRSAVVPLIERFGGEHISSPDGAQLLEGRHGDWIVAMFQFPSIESLRLFWESPEYVLVKQLRQGAAELDIWAVSGR